MSTSTQLNCSSLIEVHDFTSYVQLLRQETGFNGTLLSTCQLEICGALWGIGNPDVSGIGIVAGYITENAIGVILAFLYLLFRRIKATHWFWETLQRPVEDGFAAFFDSAVNFALAIQLASIVALVNKDFDIEASGLGAYEAQIAWAVSVVCLLPLLYPVAIIREDTSRDGLADTKTDVGVGHQENGQHSSSRKKEKKNTRRTFRIALFCLSVALFMYPFISQCMHNWAPTEIGDGQGEGGTTIISDEEWRTLESLCVGDIAVMSDTEDTVLAAFEMAASLVILIFTIWIAFDTTLARDNPWRMTIQERIVQPIQALIFRATNPIFDFGFLARFIAFILPVVLAIPLLWGIFRLREIQKQLASATQNTYTDNDWGFGQIVSIVIFAPVLFEMVYCWFVEE